MHHPPSLNSGARVCLAGNILGISDAVYLLLHTKAIFSIFYGRRIPTHVFSLCRREKNKIKTCSLAVVGEFGLFSGDFDDILVEILQI